MVCVPLIYSLWGLIGLNNLSTNPDGLVFIPLAPDCCKIISSQTTNPETGYIAQRTLPTRESGFFIV